jgi:hypothetical protein
MIDESLENTPVSEIAGHPKVVAFLEKMRDKVFEVDLSIMDEIQSYVSIAKESRETADKMKLPNQYKTKEDLHRICGFVAKVQACRDRVIEIKIGMLPLQRSIHRIHKRASAQLYHFAGIMKASPASARDAFISGILSPIEDTMSKVDMIVDACNEVDRHLGNAWFSLKELRAIGTIYLEAKGHQEGV